MKDRPIPMGRGSTAGRAIAERRTVHIPDVLADAEYELKDEARAGGLRTMLAVPLMREGARSASSLCSATPCGRSPDKQIELVETFADQAVIAIENARLLTELRRAPRTSPNRLPSRPRPPRCCRSSARHPASSNRFSRPCWRTRHGSARPRSGPCCSTTATRSAGWRSITHHGRLRSSMKGTSSFDGTWPPVWIASWKRSGWSTLPI